MPAWKVRSKVGMAMPHPQQGAFPLFKFKGIQVSLHWSWLLVAVWQIQRGQANSSYPSIFWSIYEYLALFGIVLLHEFGHAFANRQVGGTSENILLWPFGGIAYVNPPPRPGAYLWSIAAGPLVNVALLPIFWGLYQWAGTSQESLAVFELIHNIFWINLILLIFNILPIYPLDGGQILQSLLWYKLGYAKALLVAAGLGLVAGAALLVWVLIPFDRISWFNVFITAFLLNASWSGFRRARQILAAGGPGQRFE